MQLEWLHDGDLSYENWLLDPAGNTRRQQSPYNRQTRAGNRARSGVDATILPLAPTLVDPIV